MTATEDARKSIREQARFRGIFDAGVYKNGKFKRRMPPSFFVMHGKEAELPHGIFNAESDGMQAERLAEEMADYIGVKHAVPLDSGMTAMRMAVRLASERIYGNTGECRAGGVLRGGRVFCPDFASPETARLIVSESGVPVFVDCGDDDWSMDPKALEVAFGIYPDTRLVILNHAYGFPGRVAEIRNICDVHGALLIEDASEALGAECRIGNSRQKASEAQPGSSRQKALEEQSGSGNDRWLRAGTFGDYAVLDFGPDGIITGGGGMLLTDDSCSYEKAAALISHAGNGSYGQTGNGHAAVFCGCHGERDFTGCRMSDVMAAAIREQLRYIDEVIAKKKAIYERYMEKLDSALADMNPVVEDTRPNYRMSCMTCEGIQLTETACGSCCTDAGASRHGMPPFEKALAGQSVGSYAGASRHGMPCGNPSERTAGARYTGADRHDTPFSEKAPTGRNVGSYTGAGRHGTSSPAEICDVLRAFGAEAAPVYMPVSMRVEFRNCDCVTPDGNRKDYDKVASDKNRTDCTDSADMFWDECSMTREYSNRGLCLPSDIRMTKEEQDKVIEIISACYDREDMDRSLWDWQPAE